MTISQREARRLRKRVAALEDAERQRANAWVREWPGGVHIASAKWEPDGLVPVVVRTARKLGHAVVVTAGEDGEVRFYARRLARDAV